MFTKIIEPRFWLLQMGYQTPVTESAVTGHTPYLTGSDMPVRRLDHIKIAYFYEKNTRFDIIRLECWPWIVCLLGVCVPQKEETELNPCPLTITRLRIKSIILCLNFLSLIYEYQLYKIQTKNSRHRNLGLGVP